MPSTRTHNGQLQVLLLSTCGEETCIELRSRLRAQGLSTVLLPVADFTLRVVALSGVGSAVIDMAHASEGQQELADIIIRQLAADKVPITVLSGGQRSHTNAPRAVVLPLDSSMDTLVGTIVAQMADRTADIAERLNRRQVEDNITEQLQMAGRVQRDFLPSRLPDSASYKWGAIFRPAEWVSGDIYDVARLDEQHIAFYLADAVGHSMPAALLTMFLKHAILMRETVGNTYRIFEPAEVVSRLNVVMAEQALSGCQFATICYCLLNITTGELRFARAGHPYPIHMTAAGDVQSLECRGPLLGVFSDSVFHQASYQLSPGDKVILFSDGAESIIGSTDEKGAFDFSPLVKSMPGMHMPEVMEKLDSAAASYRSEDGLADDVTAIGVEFLDFRSAS
jgi:serine phosphatase RsbU (regulator of sigma subunit)